MSLSSTPLQTVAIPAESKGLEMIPPLLLAGLAAGAVARLKVSILVGVAFALASGLIVGVLDRSLLTVFGGVGLGAANFVAGWAIGRVLRCISTRGRLATR
jgi:predicted Co/Zn/Cd cation transporter (cation efflux family)